MEWTQESTWLLLFSLHKGIVTVNGKSTPFSPGAVSIIAPSARCRLTKVGDGLATSFWFRFQPVTEGAPTVALPSFIQLGETATFWESSFRKALNRMFQMAPEMKVAFSHLLWSLAQDPGGVRQSPVLEGAEKIIEERLNGPLRVEKIAEEVGVSHNQLIRLFREEHGVAPLEYIRSRRQFHACRHLLEDKLTIKQVAAEVGVSDLAQFNRLVQRAAGVSPRQLRESRNPPDLFRTSEKESAKVPSQ